MKSRLCKYCGDWHSFDAWPHNCLPPVNPHRSDYPAPSIILDTLPGGIHGMRNMADGKLYDSKSRYYGALKDQGMVIVGNDPSGRRDPGRERFIPDDADLVEDIQKGIAEAEAMSASEMQNMKDSFKGEVVPSE